MIDRFPWDLSELMKQVSQILTQQIFKNRRMTYNIVRLSQDNLRGRNRIRTQDPHYSAVSPQELGGVDQNYEDLAFPTQILFLELLHFRSLLNLRLKVRVMNSCANRSLYANVSKSKFNGVL